MKNINKNENSKIVNILGIETSCDDTCAAVVANGNKILSNVVASQHEIHKKYGGVVPELASRRHIEIINIIIKEALEQAKLNFNEISAVAVTNRPGLIGSLLVGVGAAKAISYAKKIPLIAVNHLKAHLFANFIINSELQSDFIGLIVSGGHSSIFTVKKYKNDFIVKQVGWTVDDAAGEAFDKIARFLGLGYPGGPIIDKISKQGDPFAFDLPRPMITSNDLNFSFSGLKTAIIYKIKKDPKILVEKNIPNLAASFQEAIVDVLVTKTIMAAKKFNINKILVSGGVAANSRLREVFIDRAKSENVEVFIPPLSLCLDNAAMVACLGYYDFLNKNFASLDIDVFSRSDI